MKINIKLIAYRYNFLCLSDYKNKLEEKYYE